MQTALTNRSEMRRTARKRSCLSAQGQDIEQIADAVGKSVRSVRSKLVREGVYVAKPKTSSKKVLGPTKKELLRELDGHMDTKGLEGATKEAIERLIGIIAN